MGLYKNFIKRLLDLILALMILTITLPILLIVLLVQCISSKSLDVFFLQVRPGKANKLFRVIKLKTMHDLYDSNGELLPDSERISRMGRMLRSSSLDEIPQLINVIKGDMSLIGPRPLLEEYLSHYTDVQARRHEVRPGITGWAQINGRNTATFNKRFKHDVWYVDNISFLLDLKILFITFLKVFKSDGILEQDPNKITDQ
jgi:undecaprenyl phosphate N,N'-diacetylbacillosamine 1-phosphate transferase